MNPTPSSERTAMYRLTVLVFVLLFLSACVRTSPVTPASPADEQRAVFSGKDLRSAKLAIEQKRVQILGEERVLSIPEIETPDSENEVTGDFSPQTVIAGVDGYLVYIRSNGTTWEIWRYDQANDVRLEVFDDTLEIQSVAISLDGDQIVATIYDAVNTNFEVYELVLSSGVTTNLSNTVSVDESDVSISADGSVIVWEGDDAGQRAPYLCVYTSATCSTTILSSNNNQVQPSVSGNGDYVALVEELTSGSDRIKLYNRSSATYTIVATSSLPVEHPSVNDNAIHVMYLQHDTTAGIDRIKIKNLATGVISTERSATTPLFIDHPHLTADGLYLAYSIANSTSGKLMARTREVATNLEGSTTNASWDHLGTFWQKPVANYSRVYVDKDATGNNSGRDWSNAFTNVQDALHCVRSGACPGANMVWVASGVYYPDKGVFQTDNDEAASFELISGIYLAGGFDGVGAGGVGGAQETDAGQRNFETNPTILSGDLLQDDTNTDGNTIAETTADIVGDNSDHVVLADYPISSFTVLDGFTITAGQADGDPFDGEHGGGMFCQCDATLTNLIFQGNFAEREGGALYNDYNSAPNLSAITFTGNTAANEGGAMYNDQSRPTLTFVTFEDNSATDTFAEGGAISSYNAYLSLTSVTFEGNTAHYGGAIHHYDGTLTVTDAIFLENTAYDGGAINNAYATATVTNTRFLGNTADNDGGAVLNNETATLVNSLFSGNTARYGGAIYNRGSSSSAATMTLLNVSSSRNSASSNGGAIYNRSSSDADIVVKNSILWESRANGVDNEIYNEAGDIFFNYSDIKGGWNGAGVVNVFGGTATDDGGNRKTAPRFVDFDGSDGVVGTLDDNLRLRDSSYPIASPLIDRGTNNGVTATTDLAGSPRIVDGDGNGTATVDMGAYEKQ